MKKVTVLSIGLVLLVCLWGSAKLGRKTLSLQRVHAATTAQVVIVRCAVTTSYKVNASSSSTGAPVVVATTDCADSLATLINGGFRVHNVQLEPSTLSLVYTLVRGSGDSNSEQATEEKEEK